MVRERGFRRGGLIDPRSVLARARAVPTGTTAGRAAPDVAGTDLDGAPLRVPVRESAGGARWTLLLFVKLDCLGCDSLWPLVAAGTLDGGGDPVAVVGMVAEVGPGEHGHLSRRRGGGTLAVGRSAWDAYGVRGPSFAVLVNGATGLVHWESVAWDGAQVAVDTVRLVAADGDADLGPLHPGHGGRPTP